MNTIEIRNDFHNLIDKIENENLLFNLYELIQKKVCSKDGQLWNQLTVDEQEELLKAEEESDVENNLISWQIIKEKHKKWL